LDEPERLRSYDYRSFIKQRLTRGKQGELARHLKRAESWVSGMLNGGGNPKRLMPERADAVADFFHLDDRDRRFFRALVDLEEGGSVHARERARAILRADALLATPDEHLETIFEMLDAGWHVGAVLELAKCAGFQPDPHWIAERMEPRIEVTRASSALAMLVTAGLLRSDGTADPKASLKSAMTALQIPSKHSAVAWRMFRESLRLAERAGKYYANERHIGAAILPLSEKRFDQILALVQQAFLEAAAEATVDEDPPNRLYSFLVALHPVSLYTDTTGETDDEE